MAVRSGSHGCVCAVPAQSDPSAVVQEPRSLQPHLEQVPGTLLIPPPDSALGPSHSVPPTSPMGALLACVQNLLSLVQVLQLPHCSLTNVLSRKGRPSHSKVSMQLGRGLHRQAPTLLQRSVLTTQELRGLTSDFKEMVLRTTVAFGVCNRAEP